MARKRQRTNSTPEPTLTSGGSVGLDKINRWLIPIVTVFLSIVSSKQLVDTKDLATTDVARNIVREELARYNKIYAFDNRLESINDKLDSLETRLKRLENTLGKLTIESRGASIPAEEIPRDGP